MNKSYTLRSGKYPDKLPDLVPGEYRGPSWSVKPVKNKFIFSFVSGELQGHHVTQEITEEEYNQAKSADFDFDALCRKYSIG